MLELILALAPTYVPTDVEMTWGTYLLNWLMFFGSVVGALVMIILAVIALLFFVAIMTWE